MTKKNSYDLSEDTNIRKVGLHYHRFSRFLRYLKEHNAEIHIQEQNDETGANFTTKFVAVSVKDRQKLEDLLTRALNISENNAREYTSRRLGLDDKHFEGDRANGLGNVIQSIEYYFNSDTPIGEVSIFENVTDPFSIRKLNIYKINGLKNIERLELNKQFDNISKKVSSNFIIDLVRVNFSHEFINIQNKDVELGLLFNSVSTSMYPFEDELNQLSSLYYPLLDESNELNSDLFENAYEKLKKIYKDQLTTLNTSLIIPGYIDFKTPYSEYNHFTRNMISEIFKHELNDNISSITKLIDYRYEVIKYFKTDDSSFCDWPIEIHALILLTYQEHITMHSTISKAVTNLLEDIRFIVFASKDGKGLHLQKDSLTIEELSEVLTKYKFRKNVYDSFNIDGHIILNNELYRYPDHHAAKNSKHKSEISSALIQKLHSYFTDRYLLGMNMIQ